MGGMKVPPLLAPKEREKPDLCIAFSGDPDFRPKCTAICKTLLFRTSGLSESQAKKACMRKMGLYELPHRDGFLCGVCVAREKYVALVVEVVVVVALQYHTSRVCFVCHNTIPFLPSSFRLISRFVSSIDILKTHH